MDLGPTQSALVFCLMIMSIKCTHGFPEDAYNPQYRYIETGDINIGAILSVHSSSNLHCDSKIDNIHNIQDVEALTFAVRQINSRRDLLPNITLGFVILDDCRSPSLALARAIQFMPESARTKDACSENGCTVAGQLKERGSIGFDVFYDVVGVIGTYTSKLSIIVANVLGLFQLPQISHTATSDLLSDKERFPYFFRMVPPDKYQVQVIASLLNHFNWTHVSIVYSEGSYGREGVKKLRTYIKKLQENVCIEDTMEIPYYANEGHFRNIISSLKRNNEVKVVIAYVEIEDAHSLSKTLESTNTRSNFIWLGSDAVSLILEENPDTCAHFPGSLSIRPHSGKMDVFQKHFEDLGSRDGLRNSKNPWIKELLETKKRESIDSSEHDEDNTEIEKWVTNNDGYVVQTRFVETLLIDSVYAYAHALDNVAKERCNGLTESVPDCIKRIGIFNELKSIKFNSSYGEIKFNKNGDVVGKYDIQQCVEENGVYRPKIVGQWDMQYEKLAIYESIAWSQDNVPKSSCKEPCSAHVGTIYYFTKQTCCWECLTCKVNEIVTANITRCECCPEFFWPDEETRTSCMKIEPFYMTLKHPVSISLCAVSIVGFLVCMWVGKTFLKYKEEHIIKCTSVELSAIILIGTSMAYLLTVSFLSPPNEYKCYINHVGFSFTFTWVYAPLLVKTNRIYRIFKAGKRTTRKPWFISKNSQILISFLLIFFQVVIVLISTSLTPPEVKLRMPVRTEKFVELFCNLPRAGLLSSLCYNLVLVIICTFYAFKTRKLPDNYKESRYIGFCVDTTLLIWITFLPTYFTTSHAGAKVTILAVALLLNASVTLCCLFIPRIHSLYTSMRDPCSQNGRHCKDFRIVKHVVTRKRSVQLAVKEEEISNYRKSDMRVPSAGTLTSDTQEITEVGSIFGQENTRANSDA